MGVALSLLFFGKCVSGSCSGCRFWTCGGLSRWVWFSTRLRTVVWVGVVGSDLVCNELVFVRSYELDLVLFWVFFLC